MDFGEQAIQLQAHTTGHFCTLERCSGNAWRFSVPEQRSSVPVFRPGLKMSSSVLQATAAVFLTSQSKVIYNELKTRQNMIQIYHHLHLHMTKKILLLTIHLYISLIFNGIFAQQSRFDAGIIAGLNFSELEGNSITDYFGLNTGVMGTFRFSKHGQLGMEFLFSQNGEYILPESYPPLQYGQIRLNHLEIPLHIDWLIGIFQKDQFHDWNLNLGVAYTRLIGYHAEDIEQSNVSNQIVYRDKDAFQLQAGTTYHFTKKIGLNLKASLPLRVDGLSWTLAARVIYMIG